jgi:hypothetical protein
VIRAGTAADWEGSTGPSPGPAPDGGFWVSEFQGNRLSLCDRTGT